MATQVLCKLMETLGTSVSAPRLLGAEGNGSGNPSGLCIAPAEVVLSVAFEPAGPGGGVRSGTSHQLGLSAHQPPLS